jgi:hypothetical protein
MAATRARAHHINCSSEQPKANLRCVPLAEQRDLFNLCSALIALGAAWFRPSQADEQFMLGGVVPIAQTAEHQAQWEMDASP